MLSFAAGVAVAAVLLPAGLSAATNNPPLNILISDPDNNDQHAKVDSDGSLRVASTGTSTVTGSVAVTNTPLAVVPLERRADFSFVHIFDLDAGETEVATFHPVDMSLITFPSGSDDELTVIFFDGGFGGSSFAFRIGDNESLPPFVTLTQPVRADRVQVTCDNESEPCKFQIDVVGTIS